MTVARKLEELSDDEILGNIKYQWVVSILMVINNSLSIHDKEFPLLGLESSIADVKKAIYHLPIRDRAQILNFPTKELETGISSRPNIVEVVPAHEHKPENNNPPSDPFDNPEEGYYQGGYGYHGEGQDKRHPEEIDLDIKEKKVKIYSRVSFLVIALIMMLGFLFYFLFIIAVDVLYEPNSKTDNTLNIMLELIKVILGN